MLEFLGIGVLKPKKKIYISHLKKGLETYLAFINLIISSIINHCCLIRKRLKSYIPFKHYQSLEISPCSYQQHSFGFKLTAFASSSSINAFNIFNKILSLPNKASSISYILWYKHCYYTKIKNSILVACNLYKYL